MGAWTVQRQRQLVRWVLFCIGWPELVGYALRGQPLNRFFAEGKDIPVRIRFREEDRESLDQLKGFYVPTGNGSFVPRWVPPITSITSVTKVALQNLTRLKSQRRKKGKKVPRCSLSALVPP